MPNQPLGPASIRRHDNTVGQRQVKADVAQDRRLGVEVVDGHVEEALDLAGVQVDGDDLAAARDLQHVGDELGADGGAASSDRKSTRLNSSHRPLSRMPSSA